ncbi:MAG: TauD/TfdA family dioxygenase, partial [Pseudonocardiaceae bacterium]
MSVSQSTVVQLASTYQTTSRNPLLGVALGCAAGPGVRPKEIQMYNAGLSPERTPDPGRAFHLWSSDGAVIFATSRTDAAGMLAGARDVFGPRILVHQSPETVAINAVAANTVAGQDTYYAPVTPTVNSNVGVALELYTDGYVRFGDYYPDLVFLLCERQTTSGGESFIVDGQRLVNAIASDPAQRALNRFLWDIKLEQSRPDGAGLATTGKPIPSRWPVVSRTCGGRLTVRRHRHQRLLDDAPSRADDRHHLATWAWLTEEATRTAPRFQLQPGDLLCLDNYRVFHGREPHIGHQQIMHKLWAWSDMAFGLPRPDDLFPARRVDIITEPSR